VQAAAEIKSDMPKPTETPRAELHTHLGGAVDPPILWSIAHRQAIRLPTKDYWEFEAMVTMEPGSRNRNLDEMHNRVYRAKEAAQQGVTLELCPTSNLKNGMDRDLQQFGRIVGALLKNGVRFTINTDGPKMYRTNVYKEQELLRKVRVLTPEAIAQCDRWAFEASFLNSELNRKAKNSGDLSDV
jgi:adenosine deaminase